jgi:hypothetical protein
MLVEPEAGRDPRRGDITAVARIVLTLLLGHFPPHDDDLPRVGSSWTRPVDMKALLARYKRRPAAAAANTAAAAAQKESMELLCEVVGDLLSLRGTTTVGAALARLQ